METEESPEVEKVESETTATATNSEVKAEDLGVNVGDPGNNVGETGATVGDSGNNVRETGATVADSEEKNDGDTANMDQSWASQFQNSNKERENLGRIAWLLSDAGTNALRTIFDSVHPPLNLGDHLKQTHIKTVINRMYENNVLNEKQWQMLYPPKKKTRVSSQKYDSRTLVTLLQSICHLCPPYPNGWSGLPLTTDNSLSADVVRIQLLHQQIGHMDLMSMDEFTRTWRLAKEVVLRLGGPPMRVKLHRIEHEQLNQEMQNHYISVIKDNWGDGHKFITSPMSNGSIRKRSKRSKVQEQNGLAPEDKAVMKKVHKLLVDNVQAEDLLDRLQQNQILKFSDRQQILAVSKSSERMQNLLEKILNSKLTFAFKALCESMKFKYKKIYDTVMTIRKETWKAGVQSTVDVVGIITDTLGNYYRTNYAKCNPFPWSDQTQCGIREIYAPLDILDSTGKKLHLSEFLPPPSPPGVKGQRILLEGSSGSGKSVLCQLIPYLWASQKGYFKNSIPILLHVDLQVIKGNFFEEMYDKLMPVDSSLGVVDFRNMLEENSHNVVLLLDGFEGRSDATNLKAVLSGDSLRYATVIVAANPEILPPNDFNPDSKMFCMGFSQTNVVKCMKNYLHAFRANLDHHERFLETLTDDSWVLKPYLNRPVICLLAFGFYQTTKHANLKDVTTMTSLHESYGITMAMHHCKRSKIDVIGFEFPEEVVDAANQLAKLAFKSMLDDRKTFTEEELEEEVSNPIVHKLCALNRFTPGSPYKFLSDLMQSFLAAKYIAEFSLEDITRTLRDRNMTKHPKFTQLVCFLCGLYRNDFDTQTIKGIFTELCINNFKSTKVSIRDAETPDSEKNVRPPSGQIMDFNTSLQSLIECKLREDACEIVARSLPPKIIVKRDGLIPSKCLHAFTNILQFEGNRTTHLEFHLSSVFQYQEPLFLDIAKAMGKCPNLRSVRVYWSSLELMSKFMSVVMSETSSLENVILDDVCKKRPKSVSAATWATLQDACEGMSKTTRFSYVNGKVAAITYFVLQHLPNSIEQMNFAGCAMNMMCACELASKLEKSKSIEKLDITDAVLASSEFVAILQGLKLCGTIKHLKLCGAKLDRVVVENLAECLKLTTSLQILDLSNCQLSTEMCERLAEALVQNRSLQRLVLKNTKVTSEGRQVISHSTIDQVKVVGLDENWQVLQKTA